MPPTSSRSEAFTLTGPAPGTSPLVFDSPHSWRAWPAGGTPTAATPAQLDTSWDAWVDELWAEALAGAAPLLSARFHRAYIDANRARDDIDPALLAEPWPAPLAPAATSLRGMGLIRRDVLPGVPMYTQPLAAADVRARLDRWYDPYHACLDGLVAAAQRAFGLCVHIDCHSMKSVGNAMNEDCGAARPDLVVSDLDGAASDPRLRRWVVHTLRAAGYSVGINTPYRGGELVRRHGCPVAARHSLQIEIRRSLYMDEARVARHAGYGQLVRDLGRFARQLAAALDGELGALLPRSPYPSTPRSENP